MENNVVVHTEADNTLEVLKSAPEALLLNQSIVEKAVASCNNILAKIEAEGMSEKMDETCNLALVKLKDRLEEITERRKPLTQMFDQIRKQFTQIEALIDPKQPDSVYYKLQVKRNAWATEKMRIQKEREEQAARKLRADQEKINLKAEADIQLRNGFISHLSADQQVLQDMFDGCTLESIEEIKKNLFDAKWNYRREEFEAIRIELRAVFLSPAEIELIKQNAIAGKFDEFALDYKKAMGTLAFDLIDKIPGKQAELMAMAEQKRIAEENAKKAAEAKNAADKKAAELAAENARKESERLQKEKADRELREAEDKRIADEEARKKAAEAAENNKQLELTDAMFNNAVEVSAATEEVKAIESYEIEVKNPAGWLLIAQMWHKNEGMKLSNADIEKKTFKQMKTFCEKRFKSAGEKIDSPYIIYSPVYKVRAEK